MGFDTVRANHHFLPRKFEVTRELPYSRLHIIDAKKKCLGNISYFFQKISTDESRSRITAGKLHESTSASSPGSRSLVACVDLLDQLVHCAANYKVEINTSEISNKEGIELNS